MRKPLALLTVAALSGAGALASTASAGDPPVNKAGTRTIELGDSYFAKPGTTDTVETIRVRKGTVLRFIWGPKNQGTFTEHDVTGVRGQKFSSGEPTTRRATPFRKRIKRTTSIVCTVHATSMTLKVKVKKRRR